MSAQVSATLSSPAAAFLRPDQFFPPSSMLQSFIQTAAEAGMQTTISGPVFPFSLSFWRRPWAFSLASLGACVGLAWGPVFLYRRKFMRRLGQHSWDEIEPRSNIYR
jgi:hypothetical protein